MNQAPLPKQRRFFVPENLDLPALLARHGYQSLTKEIHLDKFHYLIDRIYIERHVRDRGNEECVPVNSEILEQVVTKKFAAPIKRILVEIGVLDGDSSYRPGHYSKCYQFAPGYSESTFRLRTVYDEKLLRRLKKNQQRIAKQMVGEDEGRMLVFKSLGGLEFDCVAADEFVSTQPYATEEKRQKRSMVVDLFRCDGHGFTCDKAGRLYHALTTCSRDLRQFVTWGGKPLFAADVSNSQPALHSLLYPGDCPEKQGYVELVSTNTFYSFINSKLANPFNLEDEDAKGQLKKELFHRIFYGYPVEMPVAEVARVFAEHFPVLDAEIKKVKTEGVYRRLKLSYLPTMMQRIEADIVINQVAGELARRHEGEEFCLISIHDCLVTTKEHVEEVKSALSEAYKNKLGFLLPVKVKRISRESDIVPKMVQPAVPLSA